MAELRGGSTAGGSLILTTTNFTNAFPIGSMMLYDNSDWVDDSTIPGWYACIAGNSGYGCPNLVDSFVMGKVIAGSGVTGGSNTHTISSAELPTHTHTINHDHPSKTSGNQSASHSHTQTRGAYYGNSFPGSPAGWGKADNNSGNLAYGTGNQSASHTHSTDPDNFTGSSGDGGFANNSIDTRPAFYSVIYIRKCA